MVNILGFVGQEAILRLLGKDLYNKRENIYHVFTDEIQHIIIIV